MAILLWVAGAAWAANYPPLCVEITPEHPLFIFQCAESTTGQTAGDVSSPSLTYAQRVIQAWADLPYELKSYAVLQIDPRGTDPAGRRERLRALLGELQAADVPVVVRVADEDPRRVYPLDLIEELLVDFACVQGIQAVGLSFGEYYEFGNDDVLGVPPHVQWLVGAVDLAARYGRFISIELDELGWPRIMANAWCRPLYDKLRECAGYALPINEHRGPHAVTQTTALMGLWLEGAAERWGVGARSRWYSDAHFIEPDMFGLAEQPSKMPPALYRATILNGAMTGATVYSFAPDSDLWFGPAQHHWHEAIYPTLVELIDRGLIARQDFVRKKVRVAYQLAPARTAEEFHLNLRDIDGVFDTGFLIHGAYGMERPGQVPELILNTGRHYWVPVFSPYASQEVMAAFDTVVRPAEVASGQAWTELLDRHYTPDGEGSAFVTKVGRGIFVMNTRENTREDQTMRIAAVPAPVRNVEARYTDSGIELTWPFREGDVSYRVYKRVLPATRLMLLANDVDERRFVDPQVVPDTPVVYAVTALTNETEPYERVVRYGEYLALSVVESRVAEEVTVSSLLGYAKSQPVEEVRPAPTATPTEWSSLEGLAEDQQALARAVAERIEAWDRAFREEDLNGVLDLYSTDYEDPQGWRFQYVRRAYQWFLERYGACTMARQVRRWDFSSYPATRQIDVLLYCRFEGVATTDATGRIADVPAYFPRTKDSEIWVTFTDREGPWRIARTNPALPNFRDILSFSTGPYDNYAPGPDL